MANVRKYTEQIASAKKGKDVRAAIVSAINEVSDENNTYNQTNLNSTVILLISVPIHYYFSLSFSTLFCRPLTFSQKFLIFLLILFHLFLHFLCSFNCRPPHIFTLSEVDNFFTAKIQFYPPPYQEILCLTIFPDGF